MSDNVPRPDPVDPAPPSIKENYISSPQLVEVFTNHLDDATLLVDTILREAIALNGSDLLLEPELEAVRIRLRIDGVLYLLGTFPRTVYSNITARIKILGKLDSMEKRKTQEGQFTFELEGTTVNIRVEIVQTIFDEMIALRVLKLSTIVMEMSELGFNEQAFNSFKDIIESRAGLTLVAGPTGSGKTTTLYSAINYLNKNREYNIMTIEDPVEYQLDGVNQMPVREEMDFGFEAGLRAILRLSPDIILVGEIRDRQTATIAVESGLTGHMILSTIHTPDAVGVIYRLLDLGIDSYILNASLRGIVSQRLVRRICPVCKEQYSPTADEIHLYQNYLGRKPTVLYRGKGCNNCQNLGYTGRMGIYEMLKMDAGIRTFIREQTPEDTMRNSLIQKGFITLIRDGLLKAEQGVTTVDEVTRHSLRVD